MSAKKKIEDETQEEEMVLPVSTPMEEETLEEETLPGGKPEREPEVEEETPLDTLEPDPVVPVHSSLMAPTMRFPPGRLTQVENNGNLRRIGQILANGSRFAMNPQINFNAHHGLLIQMRNAFENREKDSDQSQSAFFSALTNYLEQAHGHIPHTMAKEEVEECVQQARTLVKTVNETGRTDGFEQVSRYLLLLANAPLAQF